jgi:two-component system nitrate/nitrite sensor histidine kinase NarX
MPRKYSLSAKLVSIGAVLLIVALASIGLTLWVTWQLEGGAAAVNEAGRLRMQAWRLASMAQSAHSAQVVADLVQQFDQSLALLRSGDASRPLFMPLDDAVNQRFVQVQSLWAGNRGLWLGRAPPDGDTSLALTTRTVEAVDALVLEIE